jgi:hypothetical protein
VEKSIDLRKAINTNNVILQESFLHLAQLSWIAKKPPAEWHYFFMPLQRHSIF